MNKWPTVSFLARDGKTVLTGEEAYRGRCPITGQEIVTVRVEGRSSMIPGVMGLQETTVYYNDVLTKYILP